MLTDLEIKQMLHDFIFSIFCFDLKHTNDMNISIYECVCVCVRSIFYDLEKKTP
jgi:hypothetical protein